MDAAAHTSSTTATVTTSPSSSAHEQSSRREQGWFKHEYIRGSTTSRPWTASHIDALQAALRDVGAVDPTRLLLDLQSVVTDIDIDSAQTVNRGGLSNEELGKSREAVQRGYQIVQSRAKYVTCILEAAAELHRSAGQRHSLVDGLLRYVGQWWVTSEQR